MATFSALTNGFFVALKAGWGFERFFTAEEIPFALTADTRLATIRPNFPLAPLFGSRISEGQ